MKYKVKLENRARREFLDLDDKISERIGDVLDDLQSDPRPPGAKKLTGREGYRIRKGDYRVLYTIDDKTKSVTVYRIGRRRDIYRQR